ncbi:hypothetical protein JTE90_028762 [Oedothorax gibbosus]|uniref:Peptidase S1 domain-containing protein n=1 Tax=Oedothorax gibbosus TaxID=931172 RepID=A0AAV6VZ19_9ARAC|nr:hypothetical protein JTE90_028762 [Oedothorax gibbosus]
MFLSGLCLTVFSSISLVKSQESPNIENCGISKTSVSGNKIVGGRNAVDGEFPWQLSLQMRILPVISDFQHICGATIINRLSNITTRASYPSTHLVVPIVHEGYNPMSSLKNDIALLRTTTPFNFKDTEGFINGACLPSRDLADNVTGIGTVTGWGTTSQGGSLSAQLKAVDVPILPDAKCKEAYQDAFQDTMLCAGYEEGGKDSCQGDSGGPFVQRSANGVSTLIGIVSWGRGCAQPKYPGVYTETAHYMDWILKTIQTLGGN